MARRTAVVEARVYEPSVKHTLTGESLLRGIVERATAELDQAKRQIARFAEKLNEDPLSAFSWSKETFDAAARHWVARTVLDYVKTLREQGDDYERKTDKQIVECICREFKDEILNKARFPERSTSPQSNETALCKNAAMASWLIHVEQKFEHFNIV